MSSITLLNYSITFTCLIGLGLSIYAYIVDLAVEENVNYKAMCDINEHMSCTKAYRSEYGRGFGLFPKDSFFYKPNSLVGILHYSLIATLVQSNLYYINKLAYWFVFLSNIASLYFAFILYFKLQTFCIVCVSIYLVNIITLILYNFKVNAIKKLGQNEQTNKRKSD